MLFYNLFFVVSLFFMGSCITFTFRSICLRAFRYFFLNFIYFDSYFEPLLIALWVLKNTFVCISYGINIHLFRYIILYRYSLNFKTFNFSFRSPFLCCCANLFQRIHLFRRISSVLEFIVWFNALVHCTKQKLKKLEKERNEKIYLKRSTSKQTQEKVLNDGSRKYLCDTSHVFIHVHINVRKNLYM